MTFLQIPHGLAFQCPHRSDAVFIKCFLPGKQEHGSCVVELFTGKLATPELAGGIRWHLRDDYEVITLNCGRIYFSMDKHPAGTP